MTLDRRNAIWLIALEVLWAFGAAFITGDILAALVYSKGGGPGVLAVLTICSGVLANAPQLIVPYLEQRIAHPIRGAARSQILMVIGWGAIAAGLALTTSAWRLLVLIIVAEAVIGIAAALNYPYYQQARMRLFPSRTRSKSYSTVLFSSQVAGIVGAVLCVPLLNAGGGPTQHNYLLCYGLATGLFALSTICYLFLRDPNPLPPPPVKRRSLMGILGDYRELLRTDRNLRWFLWSECAAWTSSIGAPFLTFAAIDRYGEGIAAQCNLSRYIMALLAVPVAHYLVTRLQPRAAMVGYYLSVIAAFAFMLAPVTRLWALAAVALIGAAGIFRVNYLFHFVAGMATDDNRTKYFALSNAVGAPFMLVCPLLGAWLLKLTANNYAVAFGVSGVLMLLGLAIVWYRLEDPGPPAGEQGVVPRVSLKRLAN